MVEFNENDIFKCDYIPDDAEQNELYCKMISVLRMRGFYADDNKDYDPCHFLSEQEQIVYKRAIEYYNSIPF